MMNHDKWINTLPGKNYNINNSKQELDPNIWLNTIPKTEKKKFISQIFVSFNFTYFWCDICYFN